MNGSIIPHGPDFVSQLQDDFLPRYGHRNASSWQPDTSLFAIFFGINDINVALEMNEATPVIFEKVFASYSSLVSQLYETGARNFLFLNMPPMERAPRGLTALKPAVASWNLQLGVIASNLSNTYRDTNVFEFDTHDFMTQILDDPETFPRTALYKNTTESCTAYSGIAQEVTFFDSSCGVPLREYLWLDNIHPTYPTHEAMAVQIAKTLGG